MNIFDRTEKEWGHTSTNSSLWHRFDQGLKASCNRHIRPEQSACIFVGDPQAGVGYLCTLSDVPYGVGLCLKCIETLFR